MITRYSSRRVSLKGFLPDILHGAQSYDRIAGYFRSSILEIAGEALDMMADGACVRVICNSELDPIDVVTASAAKRRMYQEWCRSLPEDITPALKQRLERLYSFLSTGRLLVRVLPDKYFGLIHGKAGVVTRANGKRIAFMGSTNESRQAWTVNYEIVWTDESTEGIHWVQEEFQALWTHPDARDLAEAVVQDVDRLARRVVVPDVDAWKKQTEANPAAAAIELPVYRRENGLWAHQKFFIQQAFDLHKRGGARLLLADQVGLGKTVQLALTAKLIALWSGGRVLIAAPKNLLHQWQDEIWSLLRLPSAVWTAQGWMDEHEMLYRDKSIDALRRCPRRVGIVSSGLITHSAEVVDILTSVAYDCVILDEAHRARRRNLGDTHRNEPPNPNNLLQFLNRIADTTTSLLLATATPVQLDPIEAWDLLNALNKGNESVLGSRYSQWRQHPRQGLGFVLGTETAPQHLADAWEWMRDPLPPVSESPEVKIIRRSLGVKDTATWIPTETLDQLRPSDQRYARTFSERFFQQHNPYIRHIIRRTREALETKINPQTNEPYLKPVTARLFGEKDEEAVILPAFLQDAYEAAEAFCDEVKKRPGMSSGFLKTLLLRRVGSTIVAGRITAEKMLTQSDDLEDETDIESDTITSLYPLTPDEYEHLEQFLRYLRVNTTIDPKYQEVERLLLRGTSETEVWLGRGCIIFSQYYDSASWVAQQLSERLPEDTVALYASTSKSGLFRSGVFTRQSRDLLKEEVTKGNIRLIVGTDAASEGLNLQKVGTLINLDLPWNPTRLEQRKGRIQRIGQLRDEVYIYNMRYRGSVEDRVHQLLSSRLRAIRDLFGQLPDTLEDVWVAVALRDEAKAREVINQVPDVHPYVMRYDRVEPVDWESCREVLDSYEQVETLVRGW